MPQIICLGFVIINSGEKIFVNSTDMFEYIDALIPTRKSVIHKDECFRSLYVSQEANLNGIGIPTFVMEWKYSVCINGSITGGQTKAK